MYLKALHVVGFKSFADRTTLEFDRATTAIVGPNGCGKSNVLDAIRWVLGEQSAKALRGSEMKDVIFSGTEARPPLGMAEVSLTFGECEEQLGTAYNEVTITRRVFRDGASEYEINKTQCRLRDIQTLFMDTGIGRTAYSIMEQGKIDQILSSRPEDRRAIFEEAAGITKYKSQKKEAMRKLENTDANLLRLADIIREVKRQIGSLQRQAGKARRYRSAFDELAALENRLGRHQFEGYAQTIARLQDEVTGARQRQEEIGHEMAKQEQTVTASRDELARHDGELARLREEMSTIRYALERALELASSSRARVDEFTAMRDQARHEIAGTEEKVRVGEEQLAHHEAQVEKFTLLRQATQKRFDVAQEALRALSSDISTVEAEQAEVDSEKNQQERLHQRKEQELAALQLQQRNFEIRMESLRAEQTVMADRREAAELASARLATDAEAAEARLREHRSAWEEAQRARREANEKLQAAEQARGEAAKAHQQFEARRDALAQLEQEHASAPQAAQRLLKEQLATAADFRGTLSEHISVQAGYEAPLALLLGDAVNALVLRDDGQVQSWREKLSGKEQCAFVSLRAARPAPLPSSVSTHAAKFLQAAGPVGDLVAALLEEAHVVENLEQGLALKAAQPQSTVATRTGELITRGGLLLVGQEAGASLAVLNRQAELRRLEIDLGDCRGRVDGAGLAVEEARIVHEAKGAAVEQLRAAVQAAEVALSAQRQEERAAQSALADIARQADDMTRELTRLQTQAQVNHETRQRLSTAMEAAEAAQLEAEGRLADVAEQLEKLADQEAQQTSALTELRIELATQIQQCESWQQQREPVAARLVELRELIKLRTREASEHEQRIAQATTVIAAADTEQASRRQTQEEVAVRLEEEQARRLAAQGRIDAEESALRLLRREHGEVQTLRSEKDIAQAEQKLHFGNLRERFRRDYQKELEDLPALEEAEAVPDWDILETDVAARRAALDAIGPVNLEAITEYDELEQRYTFLTGQETDLITAREQILKAIQEIHRTTRKLFADTFEQVKANFQEMFTELFGGGKATIALIDEGDPLECGIDIVARPPGKQNQNVTLLSGGERTMTAVALLFAIYMVKPSPFCVLDELDAPLDESNINRFIKILQRFVKQSQFIVITHNKRTISVADVLYGVTMEERGVSRFVSMRLQKNAAPPSPPLPPPPPLVEADLEEAVFADAILD